jgi:Putative lumazine-binding
MKYKVILAAIWMLAISTASTAQSAADSIKMVINEMFTGMREGDTIKVKSCFSETAFLQTFSRQKDGVVAITTQNASDFCKAIASMPKGAAEEKVVYKDIKVDGSMASAWAPFKLYFNGNFYSCGVNSIQMARLNGKWKIQYIIDTRRKDDCIE